MRLEVLGGQMTRLHDGTIFGEGVTHLSGYHRLSEKSCIFQHIHNG